MIRRVVFGLVIVGMCGSFALAAPTLIVREQSAGLGLGQYVAGQSYDFDVFVSNMTSATTNDAAISGDRLAAYEIVFRMENDGAGPIDNSDQAGITITSFTNQYLFGPLSPLAVDNDVTPFGPTGLVSGGAIGNIIVPTFQVPALGDGELLLATFSIFIAGDADASNTFLHVRAQGSDPDRESPITTLVVISDIDPTAGYNWQSRGVNNMAFGGGPNIEAHGLYSLLYPEPATVALMLAACGGLISRRRRNG